MIQSSGGNGKVHVHVVQPIYSAALLGPAEYLLDTNKNNSNNSIFNGFWCIDGDAMQLSIVTNHLGYDYALRRQNDPVQRTATVGRRPAALSVATRWPAMKRALRVTAQPGAASPVDAGISTASHHSHHSLGIELLLAAAARCIFDHCHQCTPRVISLKLAWSRPLTVALDVFLACPVITVCSFCVSGVSNTVQFSE